MITVRLGAICDNLHFIKSRVGSAKVCAVLKADAYGLGAKQILKCVQPFADEFAVATWQEAQELMYLTGNKPLHILGNAGGSVPIMAGEHCIIPTVSSVEEVEYLHNSGFVGKINIKINSGMNRLGIKPTKEAVQKLLLAAQIYHFSVESAFTHFFNAQDKHSSVIQFERFMAAVQSSDIPKLHCCASNCLTLPPYMHQDMVRIGIALYGFGHNCVRPCFTAYTSILQILNVKKGEHVGYGQYQSPKNAQIAAIRVGYADGYRRKMPNEARYVSVKGALCAVVGQVCMDIALIDVSGLSVQTGDRVYLVGESSSCDSLAASYGTIPYEVMTAFNAPRWKKNYVE